MPPQVLVGADTAWSSRLSHRIIAEGDVVASSVCMEIGQRELQRRHTPPSTGSSTNDRIDE